jgi:hypothetical protein
MTHMVTAPLVIATAENGSQHHVYQGSPLPAFIGQDERDRLVADGMIAAVEEPTEDPASEPGEDAPELERPAGNASLEAWAAYVLESDQASEDEIAGMSRDALREKYGN